MKRKFLNLFFAVVLFSVMVPMVYGANIDVTVSGTVYSDAGVTPLGDGPTITVLVNGVVDGTDTLASGDGTYSIANVTIDDAANDVVTVYIEDEADDGNTFTIENDLAIADLDIYVDHVILRSETGTAITNSDLDVGDDGDDDILPAISGGGTTIDFSLADVVLVEDPYEPDGRTTVNSIELVGDLDLTNHPPGNPFSVEGDWTNSGGTFTAAGITVTFDGDGNTQSILETGDFDGTVFITKDSGTVTFQSDINFINQVSIDDDGGDTSGPTINVNGFDFNIGFGGTGNMIFDRGTINLGTGNFIHTGTGTPQIEDSFVFNQDDGDVLTTSRSFEVVEDAVFNGGTGTITIGRDLVIEDNGSFTSTSGTMTIEDLIFVDSTSTFDPNGGSVEFTESDPVAFGGTATVIDFNDVIFTEARDIGGKTLTISGELTIAAGQTIDNGTIEFDGNDVFDLTIGDTDSINTDIVVNASATGGVLFTSDVVLDAVGQTVVVEEGELDTFTFDFTADDVTIEDGGVLIVTGEESMEDPTLEAGSTVRFAAAGDTSSYNVDVDWDYQDVEMITEDTFVFGEGSSIDGDVLIDTATMNVTADNLTIGGDLDMVNTGVFTAPSGTLTLTGDLDIGNGTFTHSSGTVVLDGTSQTISGDVTFNNLTKIVGANDGSDETLTFEEGSSQTVEGVLIFQGLDSNDNLVLVSADPGTAWTIDAQGVTTLEHLDVTDSTATTALTCTTGCMDGGGNTSWTFGVVQNNGGGGSRGGGGGSVISDNDLTDDDDTDTDNDTNDEDSDEEDVDNLLFTFIDLEEDYWGLEYIRELFDKGIMTGTSEDTMEPKKVLNRAQFLKLVLEAFEYDVPESITLEDVQELGFTDLTEEDVDKWYAPYIYVGVEAGLITGYEDGTVRAQDSISRVEALIILSRVLEWDLSDVEVSDEFPDVEEGDWFASVVLKALMEGIVSGYEDGTFGPSNTLLRGEGAKIIAELI